MKFVLGFIVFALLVAAANFANRFVGIE